ncbi:hypothetical protein TRFO_05465 [Tritrichomonas foetus]|uniref:Uncharacterized protein n=1 Tax=Tritrichomonas foetus TaxID=1144522 RepID=A0A1J4K7B7_9EUKA|nr:hypothetical protein TRFO_05465 [Tritrichomonas foetus]|eukprot:OHT06776.1 hypothetical protein TRFO_05465 [Tritrichomonas foetus]
MLFSFLFLCASDQSIIEFEEPTADIIIGQMRSGKKFSDVIDVRPFVNSFPTAKELVEIVDNLEFPYQSCYSDILSRLNVDCNTNDPEEQRYLALHFTQCYFNITNRLDEFPYDIADKDKTPQMSSHVYSIYTVMKTHLRNLCHFAKQSMFNEETSRQLINLFKSVIDSSKTIEDMNQTMNSSFISLTNSISTISEQLKQGQHILMVIRNQTITFETSVKAMTEVLKKPLEHLANVKAFFLMVIVSFFISMFLPEILLPMLLLTAVYFFGEKSLSNYFEWWEKSYFKIGLKIVYFAVCASYPLYKVSKNFVNITSFILKFLRIKKEPVYRIPRFGVNPLPKGPLRPRAY